MASCDIQEWITIRFHKVDSLVKLVHENTVRFVIMFLRKFSKEFYTISLS